MKGEGHCPVIEEQIKNTDYYFSNERDDHPPNLLHIGAKQKPRATLGR